VNEEESGARDNCPVGPECVMKTKKNNPKQEKKTTGGKNLLENHKETKRKSKRDRGWSEEKKVRTKYKQKSIERGVTVMKGR